MDIATVNSLDPDAFRAAFGHVFEHSPWVAERAFARRPFASLDALHAAMMEAVESADADERLALIRAHPELGGREARAGALTPDSSTEQGRLGLTALSRDELDRLDRLNDAYRARFGFPCIIALRLHRDRQSVWAEFERRLANDRDAEIRNAVAQIGAITRGRLSKLVAPEESRRWA